MNEFVFDTYALIELVRGNPRYQPYSKEKAVINQFILFEFCYNLLKENESKTAFQLADQYSQLVSPVSTEVIKEASQFKKDNRQKNLSQTDCISYIQAKKMGIKFLTGDRQFKGMPNVEFVQ